MKGKKAVTNKTISTLLVELVLLIVLGYPNTTALRAPIIIIAFAWTLVRRGTKIRFNDICFIHLFWAIAIYVLVLLSRNWALVPQGIDDIKNNVLWCAMITIIMADYVVYHNITLEEITKLLIPVVIVFFVTIFIFGTRDHENRLNISNNANYFGMIAAGLASFFMYQVFKTHNRNKLYLLCTIVLIIIGLLSGSRKTVLSIIIYFVCYYQFMKPDKNIGKALGRILVVILLMMLAYSLVMNVSGLYNTIGNRLESLFGFLFKNEAADGSVFSRLNMITLATNIIKEHPLLGIGANNFKYYTYYNTYSHNGYTEIMCSFGSLGLTIYYFPLIKELISSIKSWKKAINDAIFPVGVLISFFACEFFGVSYFSYYSYCFLGISAGLCYCLNNRNINEVKDIGS